MSVLSNPRLSCFCVMVLSAASYSSGGPLSWRPRLGASTRVGLVPRSEARAATHRILTACLRQDKVSASVDFLHRS